jgi:transcriptional regulator of arginine metabolism
MAHAARDRRKALRAILLQGGGTTQQGLCELLAARGFPTTQSTVSRDLKLLGAERRLGEDGSFVYALLAYGPNQFPSQMVMEVEHNEVAVVIRTRVGRAPAVGIELDNLRHPDILGTLAGDDTVLVVPRTISRIRELAASLRELAQLEPDRD